jgi:hypothetical protein
VFDHRPVYPMRIKHDKVKKKQGKVQAEEKNLQK